MQIRLLHLILLLISNAFALDIEIDNTTSICYATSLIQQGILDYYEGTRYGGTVGMFQSPYYWWEAGLIFGGMIENWYLCDNDTYEDLLYEALLAQTGSDYDYMPSNQTMVEGNDDQGVWGLTIMTAVERNFTQPTDDGYPDWLYMAQAIYNEMYTRWDEDNCGGGLRWQIFTWNAGYNYKNTISNACLFQLAARIGRYTGNSTYLEVANEVFEWMVDIEFIVLNSDSASVYDGATVESNCSNITTYDWSYNYGTILGGCAYMYNATNGSAIWENRTQLILEGAKDIFFLDGIMYEAACQPSGSCNTDQRVFRALLARMLGYTAILAPFTSDEITVLIDASAQAAALSCSGGTDGHTCGQNWLNSTYDGLYGLGEEDCALEIINQLLINYNDPPYTEDDGGSSTGDVNAGLNTTTTNVLEDNITITGKDRAGAGIITAVILSALMAAAAWMVL